MWLAQHTHLRHPHGSDVHMVQASDALVHGIPPRHPYGAGVRYTSCIKACPPNGGNGAIRKDRPFGQHGWASGNGCGRRVWNNPLPWALANGSDAPRAWYMSQSSDVTPASIYFTRWIWLRYHICLRVSGTTDGPGIPAVQIFICFRCHDIRPMVNASDKIMHHTQFRHPFGRVFDMVKTSIMSRHRVWPGHGIRRTHKFQPSDVAQAPKWPTNSGQGLHGIQASDVVQSFDIA